MNEDDSESGYTFTIRAKYRHERIRSIAKKTREFLKKEYLKLNPDDTVEAHNANPKCKEIWDLIGYQSQLLIDAGEIEAGEVDWKGVHTHDEDSPFEVDFTGDDE
tara:strand:- start:1278 stop:1592 length:315 start_codon:yes stop_codon:yes gene_type:complete